MRKTALAIILAGTIFEGAAFAESGIPGWDTDPGPGAYSGVINSSAYPPARLPNGAINLDDVWTQDGGARMYWNSTRYPMQLKLGSQTWVDPALVPELFPQKVSAPKKTYRPRKRVARPKVICFPADQVPESLRPKKKTPSIPLPVTEAKPAAQKAEATRVTRPTAQPAHRQAAVQPVQEAPAPMPSPLEPPPDEDRSVPAPRLQ